MDGMKKAYKVGLYGDDPRVVDGSWRKLFDDDAEGTTNGESFVNMMGDDGVDDESGETGAQDETEVKGNLLKKKVGGEMRQGTKRKRGQGTLDGHLKRLKQ